MRILWLATKLPWPSNDGGRLVARLTLEALAERGHELTVVAPSGDEESIALSRDALQRLGGKLESAPARDRWRLLDAVVSPISRRPWTIRRHASKAVRQRVRALVDGGRFDLIHAEQVQAFCGGDGMGLPLVLRAQNVESDLWHSLADRRPFLRPLLSFEARRLAAYEAMAVARADRVVALTDEDAARLREVRQIQAADGSLPRVEPVEAPFPSELPSSSDRLAGDPALVLFGSPTWWPNRDGVGWFLAQAWPRIRTKFPRAILHLFGFVGPGSARVQTHSAPADSADAMPAGSTLLVPLFVSSGVRMKILEAWARGVPVVASPAAARGLKARDGHELKIADQPESWAEAVAEIEQRRESFIDSARRALASHAPQRVGARLEAIYQECLGPS